MHADCVDIVTRTKNRPFLISRAIESVLNQTHENWRHIIVNDGGDSDVLQGALREFSTRYRGRLELIENAQSLGITGALNAGMKAAKSHYVVIHDDDDSWERTFLEKTIAALEARKKIIPNTRGIICHTTEISEKLTETSISELYRYSLNGWVDSVSLTQLAAGNFFPPISFLFEKNVFSEIGFFKDLKFAEDWEFCLRFLSRFEIAVLPEHLANYHVRLRSTGSYGNTLAMGPGEHIALSTALRNDLIRADIETEKFGLGYLVALAAKGPLSGNIKHRLWKARHQLIARWKIGSIIQRVLAPYQKQVP